MPNGVARSKRRFRLRLPQKNSFERVRNFWVRVRNGAPAQDFLKKRVRNLSGSSSKWRSRPGLPQKRVRHVLCSNSKWRSRPRLPPKQNLKPFGFDFEMALPQNTSSKLEFDTVPVRFRNSAPSKDLLQYRNSNHSRSRFEMPQMSG